MPLNGMILKKTGTNSVTGGTDITYVADGSQVNGGVAVVNSAGTDFRTRENCVFRNRKPSYDSKAKIWSKDKKSVVLQIPKLLASGEVTFNLIRIEREVHPESTAAEALELNIQGAQLLFDADTTSFWAVGGLS